MYLVGKDQKIIVIEQFSLRQIEKAIVETMIDRSEKVDGAEEIREPSLLSLLLYNETGLFIIEIKKNQMFCTIGCHQERQKLEKD